MKPPSKPLPKTNKIPPGWYTSKQLSAAWNLRGARTGQLIAEAVRNRQAQMKNFRVLRPNGVFVVPHYKFRSKG